MKKRNLKKKFIKRTSFAFLLGAAASFSPFLVISSCAQKSQKIELDERQDDLSKELQRLSYTALNAEDFENITITEFTILNESIAEKLGFVLSNALREYIEKDGENPAQYVVLVSKEKGSFQVNYKYQKTNGGEQKIKKVTMIPYQNNDLSIILEKLKDYNTTSNGEEEWKKISANGFSVPVNSFKQLSMFQIKKLTGFINTLQDDVKVYIRKEKAKDTIKYFVVKKLNWGQKIIVGGAPVKVSPTSKVLLPIINKLKNLYIYGLLYSLVTRSELKNLEHERTRIVPENPNNKFDWDAIETSAPYSDRLPKPEELQDPAATTNGKIEVEKIKGEDTLHWYITYIDKDNNHLTDEYITGIKTALPTLEEVEKYDWDHAPMLRHGDAPTDLIIATKPVISRIKFKDKKFKDLHTIYIYTNANVSDRGIVEYRRYSGIILSGAPYHFWVASNAKTKYFKDIRILSTLNHNPSYEDFNDKEKGYVAEEVRYMEVQ